MSIKRLFAFGGFTLALALSCGDDEYGAVNSALHVRNFSGV